MTVANAERLKEVVGQLRLKTAFSVMTSWLLGGQVGVALWRKHDIFYPFHPILWGFFAILFARATFQYLAGLSWSVIAEEAKTKKAESRQLVAYILCTMFIWFCSAVSLVAAKVFGKLYIVGAVVMGIFMVLMAIATDRAIRHLASRFSTFSQ